MKMWSPSSLDLKSLDMVLDSSQTIVKSEFQPSPYMFKKLENGKKMAVDSTSLTPPSWLLLDHTIAIVWTLFSLNPSSRNLNIDDLKWAYEFLKEIRNSKGGNPPDVKVCLTEIQDRLIDLYARLTSLKEEFDDIAAVFGETLLEESATMKYLPVLPSMMKSIEAKIDSTSLNNSLSQSRTSLRLDTSSPKICQSYKDVIFQTSGKSGSARHKKKCMNYMKTFPLLDNDSNIFEESETAEQEEVEKYYLSFIDDDKKEDGLQQQGQTSKTLIPTKRKTLSFSEIILRQEDSSGDVQKQEKTTKKVHCVTEMRSLRVQKSMKVQEVNVTEKGEESAYSNLKAEIRRLLINPNISKNEIMKFLKEWRCEQVDKLHNELKRLNSIEEFMKSVTADGLKPVLPQNESNKLKDTKAAKSNCSLLP